MLPRLRLTIPALGLCAVALFACENTKTIALPADVVVRHNATAPQAQTETASPTQATLTAETGMPADAATILARQQVPILCYHQIRDWRSSDSKQAKDYIVPVARFEEQIKMLADSGYQTILPDQLLDYLNNGRPLPPKPVMLTFDDTVLDQYTTALPVLEKYGYKGVFFVMTVSLGRPRYMTRAQVKELSDKGHEIGSHTWDHHNVKKYEGTDWLTQIEKPTRQLEEITGKPIKYFAYPFGLWNEQAIPELKQRGMTAAFQLATHRDEQEPLYTIRRIIASGYWSAGTLHKSMVGSFKPETSAPAAAIAVR
ncbi:polysaccharide deacetylase family protein [Pontibacter liquoris]|uniref:polysaccharide deacetylase family protein n=1 Tax=Pontibacter liquoris TaxID=2905677 RepID=UPI001FA6BA9A|nr:polysaccharide deacetylase family protein [Pontibacter liquoris]